MKDYSLLKIDTVRLVDSIDETEVRKCDVTTRKFGRSVSTPSGGVEFRHH